MVFARGFVSALLSAKDRRVQSREKDQVIWDKNAKLSQI